MSDFDELRALDDKLFDAEQNQHGELLEELLAVEFRIRRASNVVQNKSEMIDQVLHAKKRYKSRTPTENRSPDNPKMFEDCAVMTSLLAAEPIGKGETEHYRNIRVYAKLEGKWLCVSWQVFPASAPPAH